MPNNSTRNKGSEAVLATKLIAGTQKRLSGVGQLILGSGTFTPAQVISQLQELADLRNGVDTAKAAVKAALEDEKSKAPPLRTFLATFVAFVRAAFGNSPDILADFGLTPKKARTPPTANQLAAAIAKRNSTRAARGTTGKRKKASIKGAVTGVTITPVTASPAEAASAPAAPNASSASTPTPGGTTATK